MSPSQFSRTRRHAAGESATSPAVATRISVAACWKGPPSPEPPAAAAVAASHASRGGAPGTGASVATTTSRSALSITRRVTGHPGFAARVSPCGFFVSASLAAGNRLSGVDPAEPEPPAPAPAGSASSGSAPPEPPVPPSRVSQGALASASRRTSSSAAPQDVPTRMVATRPKPTAALTAMVTGSGDVSSRVSSSASYRSASSSLPSSGPSVGSGSRSGAEPFPEDLYLTKEMPTLSKPFAPPESAVPEPSSEESRPARAPTERRAPDANDVERSWSAARSTARASGPPSDPTSYPHSARQKRASAPVCFPAPPGAVDAPTAPSSTLRPPSPDARRRRAASGPPEAEMSMSEYRGRCTGTHFSFGPRVRSDSTRLGSWPEPRLSRTSARLALPPPSSKLARASSSGPPRRGRAAFPPAPLGFRFAGFFDRGPLSEYGLATNSLSRLPAPRVPVPRPFSEFCRDAAFPPLSVLEKECCRIASCIFISLARRLARRNMSRSEDIVAGFTMTSFMPAATHWSRSSGCCT